MVAGVLCGTVVGVCSVEVETGGATLLLGGCGVEVGVVLLDGPDIYAKL